MYKKDLIGQVFGKLEVISFSHLDKGYNAMWNCKCACGKETVVRGADLTNKKVTTCGCSKRRDITNEKFGRLTAIELDHIKGGKKYFWRCACDCGNECVVDRSSLVSGNTKSCGCLIIEAAYQRVQRNREGAA